MQTKLGAFCPMTPVQECITMPDSLDCIFLGGIQLEVIGQAKF